MLFAQVLVDCSPTAPLTSLLPPLSVVWLPLAAHPDKTLAGNFQTVRRLRGLGVVYRDPQGGLGVCINGSFMFFHSRRNTVRIPAACIKKTRGQTRSPC